MVKLLLIAAGGGAGSLARYLLAGWVQPLAGREAASFPLGTLVVNLVGCTVIGLLGALFAGPTLMREEYRVALLAGVLGGFTTFSAFGFETLKLINEGAYLRAGLNVVLTNVLCLAAVWVSYRLGERWIGA